MNEEKVSDFLFEIGTLRNMRRMQSQVLPESNDTIASHSFEVAIIGMVLAKEEKADENKVMKMCIFHDIAEARTGDANFIHKKYVISEEKKAIEDQIANTPIEKDIIAILQEYTEGKTKEAIIAKDADLIDQVLFQSATIKNEEDKILWNQNSMKNIQSNSGKALSKIISERNPLKWLYNMAE